MDGNNKNIYIEFRLTRKPSRPSDPDNKLSGPPAKSIFNFTFLILVIIFIITDCKPPQDYVEKENNKFIMKKLVEFSINEFKLSGSYYSLNIYDLFNGSSDFPVTRFAYVINNAIFVRSEELYSGPPNKKDFADKIKETLNIQISKNKLMIISFSDMGVYNDKVYITVIDSNFIFSEYIYITKDNMFKKLGTPYKL